MSKPFKFRVVTTPENMSPALQEKMHATLTKLEKEHGEALLEAICGLDLLRQIICSQDNEQVKEAGIEALSVATKMIFVSNGYSPERGMKLIKAIVDLTDSVRDALAEADKAPDDSLDAKLAAILAKHAIKRAQESN